MAFKRFAVFGLAFWTMSFGVGAQKKLIGEAFLLILLLVKEVFLAADFFIMWSMYFQSRFLLILGPEVMGDSDKVDGLVHLLPFGSVEAGSKLFLDFLLAFPLFFGLATIQSESISGTLTTISSSSISKPIPMSLWTVLSSPYL